MYKGSNKKAEKTVGQLAKELEKIFEVISYAGGEHWRLQGTESKELAEAIKNLPDIKHSKFYEFIERNWPYMAFAFTGGSILVPRVMISYYEAKAAANNVSNQGGRANQGQNSSVNHDGGEATGNPPHAQGGYDGFTYQN